MDKDFVSKVGQNIKKYREQKGLSQFKLAIESDVTPGAIANIEHARSDTTLTRINTIAKALDIEPYRLLQFEE